MKSQLVIVLATLIAVCVFVFTDFGKNKTVTYDCREAHWHPDYPVEVKEECRRLMYEYYQKEQKTTKKYLTSA
jgi:hypothetical protein